MFRFGAFLLGRLTCMALSTAFGTKSIKKPKISPAMKANNFRIIGFQKIGLSWSSAGLDIPGTKGAEYQIKVQ